MAIADTVWGRLVRFNAPRGSHGVKRSAAATCSVLLRIAKSLARGTRSAAIWTAPHLVMVALWICLALVYAASGLGYATYHAAVWLAPRAVVVTAAAALATFWLTVKTVILSARSI